MLTIVRDEDTTKLQLVTTPLRHTRGTPIVKQIRLKSTVGYSGPTVEFSDRLKWFGYDVTKYGINTGVVSPNGRWWVGHRRQSELSIYNENLTAGASFHKFLKVPTGVGACIFDPVDEDRLHVFTAGSSRHISFNLRTGRENRSSSETLGEIWVKDVITVGRHFLLLASCLQGSDRVPALFQFDPRTGEVVTDPIFLSWSHEQILWANDRWVITKSPTYWDNVDLTLIDLKNGGSMIDIQLPTFIRVSVSGVQKAVIIGEYLYVLTQHPEPQISKVNLEPYL